MRLGTLQDERRATFESREDYDKCWSRKYAEQQTRRVAQARANSASISDIRTSTARTAMSTITADFHASRMPRTRTTAAF